MTPDGWPSGRYAAVIVDPPWRYDVTQRLGGKGRRKAGPGHCYPTMSLAELAALPIADLLEPGGHLWLWAPNAGLLAGWHLELLDAWQVRPVSLLTWVKTGQAGLGTYARGTTEHVILAVHGWGGVPATPAPATHFEAPRSGPHSTKPAALGDLVEQLKPGGPWCELFARQQRLGWTSWGWGWVTPMPPAAAQPLPDSVEQRADDLDDELDLDLLEVEHGLRPSFDGVSTNGRKRSRAAAS